MATSGTGLCPVLATPQSGIITEDNVNSLSVDTYARSPGTTVKVSCYWDEVYVIQGSNQLTCVAGRWEPDPPVCVRKGAGANAADTRNTTTTATTSSPDEDTYTMVLILVAVACVVVVAALLVVLLTRKFCQCTKYKHMKDENHSDGSSLVSAPGYSKNRAAPFGGHQSRRAVHPRVPPSLWSVPPSQRYFSHRDNSQLHGHHSELAAPRGSASVSIQATWRGMASREWTYLSVDRLLRDIEASRRNNPNHSWRDFASLSTDAASDAKKARRM
ncbi:hypothetical protein RRG08_014549 [Elysia crispata]|uniref:Sushi domain-containing protein n=1 Tax=Elysia crispata TaxID=231223 RepID=A0AAE1CPQ4_9GAST|nr:hypothetical protein RRG08_014549 [Elysia crispata]